MNSDVGASGRPSTGSEESNNSLKHFAVEEPKVEPSKPSRKDEDRDSSSSASTDEYFDALTERAADELNSMFTKYEKHAVYSIFLCRRFWHMLTFIRLRQTANGIESITEPPRRADRSHMLLSFPPRSRCGRSIVSTAQVTRNQGSCLASPYPRQCSWMYYQESFPIHKLPGTILLS